jgi:hypothetical protein
MPDFTFSDRFGPDPPDLTSSDLSAPTPAVTSFDR